MSCWYKSHRQVAIERERKYDDTSSGRRPTRKNTWPVHCWRHLMEVYCLLLALRSEVERQHIALRLKTWNQQRSSTKNAVSPQLSDARVNKIPPTISVQLIHHRWTRGTWIATVSGKYYIGLRRQTRLFHKPPHRRHRTATGIWWVAEHPTLARKGG